MINWFVSKSDKQIKVFFTKISKSNFIACCALTFKFIHNEKYLNYYEIFKRVSNQRYIVLFKLFLYADKVTLMQNQ